MTPRRRFTIADAMVLVAATTVALVFVRDYVNLLGMLSRSGAVVRGEVLWIAANTVAMMLVLAWLVALVPLRLRPPRPPLRRLARQPGFVAAVSAAAVVLVAAVRFAASLAWGPGFAAPAGDFIVSFSFAGSHLTGALIGAWAVLAASGRWRSEPSWIDRAGRGLGVAWLGLLVGSLAANLLRLYG